MKKFLIFILALLLLVTFRTNAFMLATHNLNGQYSVYEKNKGIESEYDLSFTDAFLKKIGTGEIVGESFRFIGKDSDIDNLLNKLNVQVIDDYYFSNIRIIYGYSPRLGEPIKVSGKKVNIQIAKRGGMITVGCPIIQGSY